MLRKLDGARNDLIVVFVGLLLALAAYGLVVATAENLIMPFVFLVFGQSEFPYLSFGIDGIDFPYGFVIAEAIAFALVCLLVVLLSKSYRQLEDRAGIRDCPECLTPIPSAAKRCPECTAVIAPVVAADAPNAV